MAGKIAVDARHLLTAFDDLDLAGRVSRGEGGNEPPRAIDPALLVTQVLTRFRDQGIGAQLDIPNVWGLLMAGVDTWPWERKLGRTTCEERVLAKRSI